MAVIDLSKAHIPPKYNERSLDLTSKKFGRLTVSHFAGRNSRGNYVWLCRCECGADTLVIANCLKSGQTTSCGCWQKKNIGVRSRTHGLRRSLAYGIWANMKSRCHNPNHRDYANYGGRGISVCERWRKSFQDFIADMGQRPSPKHELDRIDNSGNYEPGNVRWVTRKTNCRNTRHNHFVEYRGQRRTIAEWADVTGIDARTIWKRLHRGCALDRVFAQRRLHRFR